jgi:hypothetical protein
MRFHDGQQTLQGFYFMVGKFVVILNLFKPEHGSISWNLGKGMIYGHRSEPTLFPFSAWDKVMAASLLFISLAPKEVRL